MKIGYVFLGIIFFVVRLATADTLYSISNEELKFTNKLKGNIAVGKLSESIVNSTAIANGNEAYAVAGAVISHNKTGSNIHQNQIGNVNMKSAHINAYAETTTGKKAFAGVYINK